MTLDEKKTSLEKLNKKISICQKCSLGQSRTHTVPGEGVVDARIVFIGEAPGRNEDLKGVPFVGRAGKVLDELLLSILLNRSQIFILNILKCRPPQNRPPLESEVSACADHLDSQLKIIDPKVIVTLGNSATRHIFRKFDLPEFKIGDVVGKSYNIDLGGRKKTVIPLYHPAVAVYNSKKINDLKNDFKVLKQFLG